MKLERIKEQLEAVTADLSGSSFKDVSLSGAAFSDVNLAGATVDNANMTEWQVQDVNLSGLQIRNADMTGASIVESLTDSMTIDGISVADLMAAYRAVHPESE